MKIFANANIWKKLVIVFFAVLCLAFVVPKCVQAEDDSIGGTLMKPICSFVVWLGDGVTNVLHKVLIKQDETIITVFDGSIFDKIKRVLAAVFLVAAVIATGGAVMYVIAISSVAMAAATFGSIILLTAQTAGYVGLAVWNSDAFDKDIDIPVYSITPEAIFQGKIPLFDVNFFDPSQETVDYSWMTEYEPPTDFVSIGNWNISISNPDKDLEKVNEKLKERNSNLNYALIKNANKVYEETSSTSVFTKYYVITRGELKGTYKVDEFTDASGTSLGISYSSSTTTSGYAESDGIHSLSYALQDTVAKWYYRVLIVALVGMMSVLVYMGIRILLSSTASDKAKYKEMLGDWIIGMVILFVMHYGMIFANKINDKIINMLGNINPHCYVQGIEDADGRIEKALIGEDGAGFTLNEDMNNMSDDPQVITKCTTEDGKTYLLFNTNLMGKLRYDLQMNKKDSSAYIGYTVLFVMMVIYLFIFTFTYMKRVVYMAFLTIIAPLVALTYPIDKVNDGQAQGFNYWFKEYTFNLLLQPMHLLLYTILISSAIELATENMIYAIVAMGFMVPAEKILREMFNFGKANTPGVFGGAAGAAMVMGGLKWIAGRGPRGGGPSGGGGSSGGSGGSSNKSANAGIYTSKSLPDVPSNSGAQNNINGSNTANNTIGGNGVSGLGANSSSTNRRKIGRRVDPNKRGNAKRATYDIKNTHGAVSGISRAKGSLSQRRRIPQQAESQGLRQKIKDSKGYKGFVAGAGAWKDGMKQKWKRNLTEGRSIRRLARMSVGMPIAAAGALVGTAAGAASGDAENAVKYGAGAAGALYGLRKYANVISEDLSVDGFQEAVGRGVYGNEEYDKKQALIKQKEMMENEQNIRIIEKEKDLERKEAKKYLEEIVPFYADNKINDVDTMLDLENVAEKAYSDEYNSDSVEKKKLARQAAFQGYHHEQMYGFNSKSKEADIEALEKKMQREKDYSDEQTKRAMKFVNNYLKYSKKVKA